MKFDSIYQGPGPDNTRYPKAKYTEAFKYPDNRYVQSYKYQENKYVESSKHPENRQAEAHKYPENRHIVDSKYLENRQAEASKHPENKQIESNKYPESKQVEEEKYKDKYPKDKQTEVISPDAGELECPDNCGTLPPCAPLSVPYIPIQQKGSKRYDQRDALNSGTLFPGLDLPFYIKTEAANVVKGPLAELQALEFVVLELGLYLDTHPDDSEAFELYRQYVAMEREARRQYVATHGPLFQTDAADDNSYSWIKDPWPWQVKGWDK